MSRSESPRAMLILTKQYYRGPLNTALFLFHSLRAHTARHQKHIVYSAVRSVLFQYGARINTLASKTNALRHSRRHLLIYWFCPAALMYIALSLDESACEWFKFILVCNMLNDTALRIKRKKKQFYRPVIQIRLNSLRLHSLYILLTHLNLYNFHQFQFNALVDGTRVVLDSWQYMFTIQQRYA